MAETEEMLMASDAGKILGITGAGIRHYIKSGQLIPDSKTSAGYALFWRSTIKAFRDEREKRRKEKGRQGRPPKKAPRRRRKTNK